MSPRRGPARSAHARRARLYLAGGGSAFGMVAVAVLLMRPAPAPYSPGDLQAAGGEITSSLSRSVPADAPRVRFTDAASEAGIGFVHFQATRSTQLPEDMGSGVAWGDYDGDDDPDLYLVNEAGPLAGPEGAAAGTGSRSALYRNEGAGRFTDVTEAAGVGAGGLGMGAAWGDYDGDGDLDLVVTRFGTNLLYRNNADGTFTDASERSGLGRHRGFWTGASWADYDRDGDLDLYVCGYVRYRVEASAARKSSLQYGAVIPYTLNPSSYEPERNLLWRNDRGVFREVARAAGVDNLSGRSLSASWADFDQDGWPDLYVANDISDNAMYRNLGGGAFEDVSHESWVADHRGAMGLGVGDWDNDADLDIFITHWIAQENALYDNQNDKMPASSTEPTRFVDQADMLGLGQISLDFIGWGTGFLDFDNDGRLDLFAANGSTFPREDDSALLVPMANQLFWNAGPQRGFFEVGAVSGGPFERANVGRGAAFADYDADGDLDIAVGVNGGPARLLRNDLDAGNGWLRVVLRGPARGARRATPATSTYASGALVTIVAGASRQIRALGAGSSYLSQDPPGETHFGVGTAERIDRLEISWPSGATQAFEDLPARSTVRVIEGGEVAVTVAGGRG